MKHRGQLGENYVVAVLERRGWTILLRNWRDRYAEVDMVALSPDRGLHLIEVKARKQLHSDYGSLLESIRPAQLRRLRSAFGRLGEALPDLHWNSVHIDAAFVLLRPLSARVYFLPDCHG